MSEGIKQHVQIIPPRNCNIMQANLQLVCGTRLSENVPTKPRSEEDIDMLLKE